MKARYPEGFSADRSLHRAEGDVYMEDAIRIIEGLDTSNSEENIKAKKMAVAAMKKQIPQRPVEHFTGNEWERKCPVCGGITNTPTEVIEECIQYCGWCGQRFDWSDEQ